MWFNEKFITNILLFADVRKVCRITMDTGDAPEMCVHRLDGSLMVFKEHASGLYVTTQVMRKLTSLQPLTQWFPR